MITALHATTPDIGDLAPIDDLSIRDRSALDGVLADPGILGGSARLPRTSPISSGPP